MPEYVNGTRPDQDHGGSDELRAQTGFRRRRFSSFLGLVDAVIAEKGEAHVLDIGGTYSYWQGLAPLWGGQPLRFTLINLDPEPVSDVRFVARPGNACAMPDLADRSFDIVHSNSVIEHVGRWADMRAMAREVGRLAPRYFVQTPAFGFPVEPHFRAPFFHWVPEPWRIRLARTMPLGFYPRARDLDEAMRFVEDAALLDYRRMRELFPDAEIVKERFFGLTKSFIAIRR